MPALSAKTKSVLNTLCSNYRGDMRISATFRCSIHFGLDKFLTDLRKSLNQLEKAKYIQGFYIGAEEIDEETDLAYFEVSCDLNMSVDDMAAASVNSQTVFVQRTIDSAPATIDGEEIVMNIIEKPKSKKGKRAVKKC